MHLFTHFICIFRASAPRSHRGREARGARPSRRTGEAGGGSECDARATREPLYLVRGASHTHKLYRVLRLHKSLLCFPGHLRGCVARALLLGDHSMDGSVQRYLREAFGDVRGRAAGLYLAGGHNLPAHTRFPRGEPWGRVASCAGYPREWKRGVRRGALSVIHRGGGQALQAIWGGG
jgi:hypothetical protein